MEKTRANFIKLFISTLSISAFTFGGGFVIVSMMRKKFVEQYKWLSENEMIDITSIAQSSPGAIAVNASILLGYRLLGLPGILVAMLGTLIPPVVIISVVAFCYNAFLHNIFFKLLLIGMKAGVAAVVIDAAISMAKIVFAGKNFFGVFLSILSFVLILFLKVNAAIVILICGIAGVIYGKLVREKKA